MADSRKNNRRGETEDKISYLHSDAAEQSVLGIVLDNVKLYHEVRLSEEDFFTPIHRLIWRCLGDVDGAVDPIALSHDLHNKSDNLASSNEMLEFIYGLIDGSSSSGREKLQEHAAIVIDHSVNRKLLKAAHEIEMLSVSPIGADEKFSRIEEALASAREATTVKLSRSVLDAALNYVDNLQNSDGLGVGVPTGFGAIDDIITCMMPGDLIILGGRPGMGKTSLAMNIAERIAEREGHAAGVFSFEMPDTQLAMRTISGLGEINSKSMRSGNLNTDEWIAVKETLERLKGMRLYVDDISGCTPAELRSRVKRMIARHGKISVLVVDYIQLMKKSDSRMSEQEAISEFSGTLKSVGKEFGFPVIALSQLSRDVEKRVDKRPMPSDLRGSGSLEQDADLIVFVYRDEVYNKDTLEPGIAEVIIGKNRSGSIGTARVGFNGKYTNFFDLDGANAFDHVPF